MKKIQILGTGCPKCHKLAQVTEEMAEELGLEYTLEKVTDIMEITKFGVMIIPALVVDGHIKAAGRVPNSDELKKHLMD